MGINKKKNEKKNNALPIITTTRNNKNCRNVLSLNDFGQFRFSYNHQYVILLKFRIFPFFFSLNFPLVFFFFFSFHGQIITVPFLSVFKTLSLFVKVVPGPIFLYENLIIIEIFGVFLFSFQFLLSLYLFFFTVGRIARHFFL